MLILLPPSEGKASAGDGPPLDLSRLSLPGLTSTREKVVDALVETSHAPDAADVLGLTPRQATALDHNRALRSAPTLRAATLYTGVLYDNLGLATLPSTERLVIFSGLWGALSPEDRVPPYRLSMGVTLPPVGPLGAAWRPALQETLGARDGLVVDMRSAAYAAAWNPGERGVTVRVLREVDGRRSVVSHMAKATRGAVARALIAADATPESPQDLARDLTELDWHVELREPQRAGRPWGLDCVVGN
ncbi:peroxide stress protein YaaA [Spiractinospora alimapuensis]|uniref:YaaA family protein n=1 Tax=Spiractinospora alimapuensis TaxID=2820884 RepID=UPI001F38732C|nr:peroxide stress protein YaaA [Spiractinospora alimapuensis]QVQ54218.1 peroxide stress protein YaaA [Spiractinospora alimapuensis]